jgi:hypothetical protein
MGRQIKFYAEEADKSFILKIINDVIIEPVIVPYIKDEINHFDDFIYNKKYYITESCLKNKIVYSAHKYYDDTEGCILDYRKSPVFEFSTVLKNSDGYYGGSRFYTATEDTEFSKKVSRLFSKVKKEFWYCKYHKCYISKNIDIENAMFFSWGRINREDLT